MKLLVFIFFLFIFLISSGGHLDANDGKHHFMLTENLVLYQTQKLHADLPSISKINYDMEGWLKEQYFRQYGTRLVEDVPDAMYIGKAPLLSYIAIPFYIIESYFEHTGQLTPFFVSSIILSFIALIVFDFGAKLYQSRKIGFLIALVTSISSFLWPYVSAFFQQPLVTLLIIAAFYFLYICKDKIRIQYIITAGVMIGLIPLATPGYIFTIPGIILYGIYICRNQIRKIFPLVLVISFFVYLQMHLNYERFNSVLDFGFGRHQTLSSHRFVEGLYGMILSPGFGLIVNFPLILLIPFAIIEFIKKEKILLICFLYVIISIWVFYGTLESPIWHGYGGWGPRYMVPAIPLLALLMGSILHISKHQKIFRLSFVLLGSVGFIINLLGVLVWYQIGYMFGFTSLRKIGINDNFSQYFAWDINHIPVVLHLKVLFSGYWENVSQKEIYTYWLGCIPDNFIYCKLGELATVISIIGLAIITYFTVKKIRNLAYE